MSWPLAGSREGRLYGVDLARFVALIGMALVHILPTRDELGHTELAGWIASGRASALFAVLAGVGIALASGGARPERSRPWGQLSTAMLIRCVILVALGLWLADLSGVGVYVILAYYGVLFALAVPFLRLRALPLAVLAAGCALAMPVLQHLLIPHLPAFDGSQPTFPALADDPWRVTTYVLVSGVYPVLPWLTYLFAGMAAGRLPLGRRDVQVRLALGGLALGAAAWVTSWLLLTAGGVAERLPEVAGTGVPVMDVESGHFSGSTFTSTWWWLVVVSPHSSTPFDLAHTTGFAFAVLGGALLLCGAASRVGRWVLAAPVAAGSMTLTLYTVHVLALRETPGDDTLGLWFTHVALALVVGLAWRSGFPRGPVEQVVHWASWGWLPRRDAAPAPSAVTPPQPATGSIRPSADMQGARALTSAEEVTPP